MFFLDIFNDKDYCLNMNEKIILLVATLIFIVALICRKSPTRIFGAKLKYGFMVMLFICLIGQVLNVISK